MVQDVNQRKMSRTNYFKWGTDSQIGDIEFEFIHWINVPYNFLKYKNVLN